VSEPAREGEIRFERVTKRFGPVVAVNDVSFVIRGGEFFSMLGPSGCGKTTSLRMIAGFEQPDAGRVLLQGEDVTWVSPRKRNVNMVFQAYGLFPHMTVAQNVAFGLEIKRVAKAEREQRVAEMLRIVQLDGYERRRPGQLSGGQQQRVALARALVNRPAALLLDEPLGALDLKLRKEMQLELKAVQGETGTTFVYVTHDQEEALTMSDRIAVMNGGVVEQLAGPRELYERPATAFVAGFIGTSNLIKLRVDGRGDGLVHMDLGEAGRIVASDPGGSDAELQITVRPEKIKLEPVPGDSCHVDGTVAEVVYLGSTTQMIVELPTGERLAVHRLNDDTAGPDPAGGDRVTLHWGCEHSFVVGSRAAAPVAEGATIA
jgi:spermidine/putrescine transport system ATP-binding protein